MSTSGVAAIILAGGSSSRMDGTDKLWHSINGRPLLAFTMDVFETSSDIDMIVLATSANRVEDARALCEREGWTKVARVVQGGSRRQDTVAIGLAEVINVVSREKSCEWLMIHDGARPLVTHSIIAAGRKAVETCDAAIPVIPAPDTVKEAHDGFVLSTRDRSKLFMAQTPQCFRLSSFSRACSSPVAKQDRTDDAMLIELLGERVSTFPGSSRNIKVTTQSDLVLVEALLVRAIEP